MLDQFLLDPTMGYVLCELGLARYPQYRATSREATLEVHVFVGHRRVCCRHLAEQVSIVHLEIKPVNDLPWHSVC